MSQKTYDMNTTGYSGTPLVKKLGIKAGDRIHVVNAPANYFDLVAPLPNEVTIRKRATDNLSFVHLFTTSRAELAKLLAKFLPRIQRSGMIWVSWPKKAAKVETDVTEDVVRSEALKHDLVDVKVAVIDNVWSGLKLVVRVDCR
ncbi:MAG: hypothetical protein KDE31_27425 [Caldilineaceae bacterium]|nr:hypothetical protein [Caldilineaceae bacterium]